MQDQQNPRLARDLDNHGVGGPWPVSDLAWATPLSAAFVRAGGAAGLPDRDINAGNGTGCTVMQTNTRRGKRFSTAKSFLKAGLETGRLTVLTRAAVERVVVERGRAVGVLLQRRGRRLAVRARREIVISAGVVGSPKLLLLRQPTLQYHAK